MISTNSRYIKDKVCRVQDSKGNWNLAICHHVAEDQKLTYTYYTIKQNDRLDRLAQSVYSDGTLWWVIADANPEVLYWDNIAPGVVIRVPVGGTSIF